VESGDGDSAGGGWQHDGAEEDLGARREPRNGSGSHAHCWSACGRESRRESDARRPAQMFSVASPPPPSEITARVSIIWRHARPSIARCNPGDTPLCLPRQRPKPLGSAKHAAMTIFGAGLRIRDLVPSPSNTAARRPKRAACSEARAPLPHVAASGVCVPAADAGGAFSAPGGGVRVVSDLLFQPAALTEGPIRRFSKTSIYFLTKRCRILW